MAEEQGGGHGEFIFLAALIDSHLPNSLALSPTELLFFIALTTMVVGLVVALLILGGLFAAIVTTISRFSH